MRFNDDNVPYSITKIKQNQQDTLFKTFDFHWLFIVTMLFLNRVLNQKSLSILSMDIEGKWSFCHYLFVSLQSSVSIVTKLIDLKSKFKAINRLNNASKGKSTALTPFCMCVCI